MILTQKILSRHISTSSFESKVLTTADLPLSVVTWLGMWCHVTHTWPFYVNTKRRRSSGSRCPISKILGSLNSSHRDLSRQTWARKIKNFWCTLAVKAKIIRYTGILYELKQFLPLSARKNNWNSFIQFHLNYFSLVWGLSCKSSIEKLFTEQKKAIWALDPGFNLNFYKNEIKPCHTERFFAENGVLTVHSVILTNSILFMFKYYNYNQYLPSVT